MSTVTTWRCEEGDDAVSDFDTGTRHSICAGSREERGGIPRKAGTLNIGSWIPLRTV